MKAQISQKDWQQLSAYVDGQLGSRDRMRLEARLSKEPGLQSTLDDLRLIKTTMGELPIVPAPRNFTLTPEMAGQAVQQRRSARLYSTFRMASLVSSLLFVLIFLGDIFSVGRLASAPFSPELAAPAAQRSADELQSVPADAETLASDEMEAARDMPAEEKVESENEASEGMEEAENLAMEAAPQEEAENALAEPLTSGGEDAQEKEAPAGMGDMSASVTPTLVGDADFDAESEVGEDNEADDALPDAGAPSALADQDDYLEVDSEIPRADSVSPRPAVILEIFFAVIAIISGVLAFTLRRRGRL